jgi:uncharacterized membrane protein HdeD (DUF308 family)
VETGWLTLGWRPLVLRGVIAVLFGIVAMAWPSLTIDVLVVLFGVWALLDGLAALAVAFGDTRTVPRWILLVTGVASLIVAFFAIFSPGIAAEAITWVLGVWLLARGVLEAIVALVDRIGSSRGVTLLNALVDVLLGTLFVTNPGGAAVGIAFILGLVAFVWGLAWIALGVWMRSAARDHTGPSNPPLPA